jgi:hypothetical protein
MSCVAFRNKRLGIVSPVANPQAGGPRLIGCRLHPQPENAFCLGDRDPYFVSSFKHDIKPLGSMKGGEFLG